MAAVTVLSVSSIASSSVATLNAAVPEPAWKVALAGAVPEMVDPVSSTVTVTVSAAVVSPVRVKVNSAAVPSVTEVVSAAMVTSGIVGGGVGVGPPSSSSTMILRMLLPNSPGQ